MVAVALADFLFYGHMIGWTAAAFAAALLILISVRSSRYMQTAGGKVIAIASIGLLVALIEQPTWLNVPYAILCLGGLAIVNASGWPSGFAEWTRRWGRLAATGWMRLFSDHGTIVRCLVRYGVSPRIARSIVGWIVPVALALVFLLIFAWANPIIAEWISSLGSWLERIIEKLPDYLNPPRILFWLAFAIFAWMLLRGRGRGWRINNRRASAPQTSKPPLRIDAGTVVRCLILFNLVFLIENVLDVRYLGNKSLLLPTGIEYREYVRRGAYPLVAAALLAGAFVLITFRTGSETGKSPLARRLVYLWIGQTIFLTATAAWRLEQYVEMSELTRLRVASIIWFFLVAMGLACIIWRILKGRTNLWLLNANALTAAVVLYACCFVNFDSMIAGFNVRHCREGGGIGSSLDLQYFRDLGTTSLAQLDAIRPKLDVAWRRAQAAKISADLHQQMRREMSDWRRWTLRRMLAARAVEAQTLAANPNQAGEIMAVSK